MTHDHDAIFRSTFRDPQHAAALLREILPPALVAVIDWTTLTLVPGSFVDESLRDRHTDLLFSAEAAGQTILIYVVLEHKSFDDRFTALQVLGYAVRVLERFHQEHPEAKTLPPVVAVVVHHGERGWQAPRTVLDLIALDAFPPAVQRVLAPLQPNLHFLLDDLAVVPESRLRARKSTPQGMLTLLALQFVREATKKDPVAFAERWLPLWRALWADPDSKSGLISLLSYLAIQLEAPRERFKIALARIHGGSATMGKTIAQQWLEEGMEKGMEKGKAEGVAMGRADLLMRQVRKRFGDVSPQIEARVRAADVDTLDRWGDLILTAATLDELFA